MSEPALPATEQADPRTTALETWPTLAAARALWEGQLAAAAAVGTALPAITAAVEAACARLGEHGRLIYCGAGTSGRLGVLDASELPPTFDWPEARIATLIAGGPAALTRAIEGAEDRADTAESETTALHLTPADILIAIAASGNTPYVLAAARAARAAGALVIAITSSPGAPLLSLADHPILVETAPEPIAGSTRLKSGTAQKIVLNLLSTLIMIRLGRVWRGLMVDVVARNAKLRARAVRIVQQACDATPAEAEAALEEAGGRVKLAILLRYGLSRTEAAERLRKAGGNLGAVRWPQTKAQ